SIMIARGAGFDLGLAGLRTDYPDGSYFEFSTLGGRSIADLEVDVQNDLVSISRAGASSTGDYSLTVTDLNDVETKEVDNCWFEAPLDTGFISFGGADYGGGDVLETMWELNDAPSNGSVIAYYVDRNDGTDVSENTFALNVWDIGTLNPTMDDFSFAGPPPIADDDQIVIVTFDIDSVTADDVFNNAGDPSYVQGSTNLSLSNLPGWLYFSFGEDLNYIGISVWDYNS
ncbi:MAG TPA: hypothetical protein DCO79_17195, partial [Spirochaeta sp.]|nr:hypothetical protein [Spirochaeta sp.]